MDVAVIQGGAGGGGGQNTLGTDDGACGGPYGAASYGNESDDDDCKYHVVWSSTPICGRAPVTFTMTLTDKVSGLPGTGAAPYLEIYTKGCTHSPPPGPCACTDNTGQAKVMEEPPGTYVMGPYFFDEAGTWVIRYHIHPTCTDNSMASPHAHAAYWIEVP